MVCWTVIGLVLGTCAYLLGWRRWVKAAPYVVLGWIGLVLYSATCPLVHGHWGWIVIGRLKFDILAFAPVGVSLLASHLVRVFKCRAILIVGAALLVSVGLTVRSVVGEPDRAERFLLLPSHQKMAEAAHRTMNDFALCDSPAGSDEARSMLEQCPKL